MPRFSKQTPRPMKRLRMLPTSRLIAMALQEWDTDSAIRERLWQNTRDASANVREEALCALASRGDTRAEELLSQLP